MFFERSYFLTPAGGSTKAYRLLAETMERTGRAGIATFVMRGKEYLVAILADDGILSAETLRFADEMRSPEDVGLPAKTRVSKAEATRLEKAIRALTEDELDPKELEDAQGERLLEVIAQKQVNEKNVVHTPAEAADEEEDVIDLMAIIRRNMRGERTRAQA
jgi:DNA end-binding protein Ku